MLSIPGGFHTVALMVYSWALYIEIFHFARYYYSFSFKFATVWFNLYCVFYHLCATVKVYLLKHESNARIHESLKKLFTTIADYTYASVIFPQAPLISFTFWAMYCMDPVGAVPLHVQRDQFWIYATHIQHSLIVVTLVLDFFLNQHNYPRKSTGIKVMLLFTVGYNMLHSFRGIVYNDWAYNFFNHIQGPVIGLLYVLGNIVLTGIYLTGHFLNAAKQRLFPSEYQLKYE